MAEEKYRVFASLTPVILSGQTAEITASQTLTNHGPLLHASGPAVKVLVEGPQTSITDDDIAGVYPASGSTDSPDNFLPHIALTRRTLPWERRGPVDGTPWLALLVVTEADLTVRVPIGPILAGAERAAALPIAAASPAPAPKPPAAPVNNVLTHNEAGSRALVSAAAGVGGVTPIVADFTETGSMAPKSVAISELAATDAATHAQLLTIPGLTNSTQINTIAIPAATLKEILPVAQDLKYFCNVKEVVQDDGTDTYTAIVMSARLPYAGDPNANRPSTHTALLVSLEHREDIYTRWEKGGWINLIVLHSWTFIPSKGGDFQEVCEMIRYRPNGGVLRFGNLPAGSRQSAGFSSLLDSSGFLLQPLDHAEAGNVTWRSPLRPFPPPPRAILAFAVRSDPEEFAGAPAGTPLDYSHATAFELGKMLALADVGIREDLHNIHEVLNVPAKFVDFSAIPPALQKPYWGVDQRQQSIDQAQQSIDQGMQNPWSMGTNQSMLGVQNIVGNGQVAGIPAQNVAAQLDAAVTVVNAAATAPAAPANQNTPIDIGAVTEASLAAEFPELVNAGIARGI